MLCLGLFEQCQDPRRAEQLGFCCFECIDFQRLGELSGAEFEQCVVYRESASAECIIRAVAECDDCELQMRDARKLREQGGVKFSEIVRHIAVAGR